MEEDAGALLHERNLRALVAAVPHHAFQRVAGAARATRDAAAAIARAAGDNHAAAAGAAVPAAIAMIAHDWPAVAVIAHDRPAAMIANHRLGPVVTAHRARIGGRNRACGDRGAERPGSKHDGEKLTSEIGHFQSPELVKTYRPGQTNRAMSARNV
jgi:hypothetical protein